MSHGKGVLTGSPRCGWRHRRRASTVAAEMCLPRLLAPYSPGRSSLTENGPRRSQSWTLATTGVVHRDALTGRFVKHFHAASPSHLNAFHFHRQSITSCSTVPTTMEHAPPAGHPRFDFDDTGPVKRLAYVLRNAKRCRNSFSKSLH